MQAIAFHHFGSLLSTPQKLAAEIQTPPAESKVIVQEVSQEEVVIDVLPPEEEAWNLFLITQFVMNYIFFLVFFFIIKTPISAKL